MELTRERAGKHETVKQLKRLWNDLNGCESLTLEQIDKTKSEAAKYGVYPDLESYYLDREDMMNYDLKRTCKLVEFWHDKGVLGKRTHPTYLTTHYMYACVDTNGLFLHFDGFTRTIELLGSDDQVRKWLPKCLTLEAIGCY